MSEPTSYADQFRRALVTGASGFVGSHFLSLLRSGFPELSLTIARRSKPITNSPVSQVQYVEIDLARSIEVQSNPDIIFHIAGEKRDESLMWSVNLEGTRRLVDWAANHGVKRFVYLSSVGVYGAPKDSGVIAEDAPRRPQNVYEASKNAAEDWVRQECPKRGIEYVILQPSNVIGLSGGKAYPLLGMMKAIKRGMFVYFGDGHACLNYVSVEDVAGGLAQGLSPGAINRTFILNCPTELRIIVDWIADAVSVRHPHRSLPTAVGYGAGEIANLMARVTRRSLPFSRERFCELTNTTRYDGSAIIKATSFSYALGIETAIRNLAREYQEAELL